MRKVYVGKIDLDVIGCGFILGVSRKDKVIPVRGQASEEVLEDPKIVCIECGGSGQVGLLNFDHHEPDAPQKSATWQAFEAVEQAWEEYGKAAAQLVALGQLEKTKLSPPEKELSLRILHTILEEKENPSIDYFNKVILSPLAPETDFSGMLSSYVDAIDVWGPEKLRSYVKELGIEPGEVFPSLSDVVSGMMLRVKEPREQFFRGIEILKTIQEMDWDDVFHPKFTEAVEGGVDIKVTLFGPIQNPAFADYVKAKLENSLRVEEAVRKAQWATTKQGRKMAYLETEFYGAPGALYALGAEIVVVLDPRFRGIRKFTIAGNNGVRVDSILPLLSEREAGWGGPSTGTIIGSPQEKDSQLSIKEVVEIVRENL